MNLIYYCVKCSNGSYYNFCNSCLDVSFSFDCLTTDFKIATDCKLRLNADFILCDVVSFGSLPRVCDFYYRCKEIDALTWLDVSELYRKRNQELYSILEKIAKHLNVYSDGTRILDFIHDTSNNVILNKLGIGGKK